MKTRNLILLFVACCSYRCCTLHAQPPAPTRTPLVRAVDLDVGESIDVGLCDGSIASVRLLNLAETRDDIRGAVREAVVDVEVNGQRITLTSATYRLPQSVAGVRIDCPITRGYTSNSIRPDVWGLRKDARLRLWPGGSPLVSPDTFVYPAKQRWFASDTQMANDPCYVDGGEQPQSRSIYYHYGLDVGGAEGMVDVVAATSGLVVSSGTAVMPGFDDTPTAPRYDVVYLLDERGWYYRYSHLMSIDEGIRPGRLITMGQKIVRVEHIAATGMPAIAHLHVVVEP